MCADIEIIDDEAVENNKYFYVELSTSDSDVQLLTYYQRKGFYIYDNDGKICSRDSSERIQDIIKKMKLMTPIALLKHY